MFNCFDIRQHHRHELKVHTRIRYNYSEWLFLLSALAMKITFIFSYLTLMKMNISLLLDAIVHLDD